jgi:CBS domain-containing protein
MARQANAVPVLDDEGRLVGELSRRMILGFLVQNL